MIDEDRRANVQTCLALRLDTVLYDVAEVDGLLTMFPDIALDGTCREKIRLIRRELDYLERRSEKRAA